MNQILDAIRIALQSIWTNKLRSFMMVLGNIVAVTSIIAVVSLIQGMNGYVAKAIVGAVGVGTFKIEKIGIVSNHAYDLRPLFQRARLDGLIDAYALSYEVGVAKPSPLIFEEACRRMGVPAANTLMVGDDAVSDGGAVDAGLQLYLLGPYQHGGERGLARVVEIVDASRVRQA